jgi:hypothetical protein
MIKAPRDAPPCPSRRLVSDGRPRRASRARNVALHNQTAVPSWPEGAQAPVDGELLMGWCQRRPSRRTQSAPASHPGRTRRRARGRYIHVVPRKHHFDVERLESERLTLSGRSDYCRSPLFRGAGWCPGTCWITIRCVPAGMVGRGSGRPADGHALPNCQRA